MRCMVSEDQTEEWKKRGCLNLSAVRFTATFREAPLAVDFILHHLMTLTSDTDSCTAAEPIQVLTPPPSPPLAEDDAATAATTPSTSASAKKKKKKKSKKSSKAKDPVASPPPPTPTPTAEENQPPPLYISRNKHWKYISSFHVRVPLGSERGELKFKMTYLGTMVTTPSRTPRVFTRSEHGPMHAFRT